MIIGTIIQQPNEVLDYEIQYDNFFKEFLTDESADTILEPGGLSVKVEVEGELSATVFYVNDAKCKVVLQGGLTGTTYKVTVTMTSVAGRVKEDELLVIIEEF